MDVLLAQDVEGLVHVASVQKGCSLTLFSLSTPSDPAVQNGRCPSYVPRSLLLWPI